MHKINLLQLAFEILIHSKFEVKLPSEESIEFFVTSIQKALSTSKQQVYEWPKYGHIMWKCPTQLEVIEQVLPVGQKVKQVPAQTQRAKKAEEGQKSSEGEQKEIKETQFFACVLLS